MAWKRAAALIAALGLGFLMGCAAKTPRDRARVATVTVGEAILGLDQAEWALYNSKIPNYTQADHERVGTVIRRLLYAGRAFNTAVAAWPADVQLTPAAVAQAMASIGSILSDLEKALPSGAEGLVAAIAAIRSALISWTTHRIGPDEDARLAGAITARDAMLARTLLARGGRR